MRTPISSVDTNLEQQGYEGAAMLDRLMDGAAEPEEPVRVSAARVVARKSSDILAVSHTGVARGLRFIWDRFQDPIRIEEVARAASMSRRGLHQAFVDHLNRTPGEEIRSARAGHAKKLLTETRYKIEAISGLSGYQSTNSFCAAFKKNTGMSPSMYRKMVLRSRGTGS